MSWAEDEGLDSFDPDDFRRMRTIELMFDEEALRLYWTTKDGAKIFIEDMETSHIENIIRADLDGRLECSEETQDRLLLELSIRRRTGR